MRSLFSNLRDPKNPDLKKRLINGELTPQQVATLDSTALASKAKQAERERMDRIEAESRRNDYENQMAKEKATENVFFNCPECKSKKIDIQ